MKTLDIELWGGQIRGEAPNHGTRVAKVSVPRAIALRDRFVHGYARFAPTCRAVDEPGVALIAIDEDSGAPAGVACLRARPDRHVAAIVGRHDRCDLYLASNDRLALRQLAVIVSPVEDWRAGSADVSYRIIDLRTHDGMIDEESRPLRGLRSEGPAIVRCGGHVIFALPLGDPTDWPESAEDAWSYLPERIYFDELVHPPDGSIVRPPLDRHITVVTRTGGPRHTGMKLVSKADLAGRLDLVGPAIAGTLDIGHAALRDGVLLGRYDRCNGAPILADHSLSRVHALLVHVDDRLLLIDTASTNGTRRVGGDDARLIELVADTDLELGDDTRARWTWVS
ncbi:MAG: FHA domain-containing protein [Deltaproteobacteria bacterium]|nr:FHA domain-containing protein [Deltaproteobacteria bacterium]MDQ3295426.1 FHA domain-containing protein [Myxococcota bacterium]